MVLLYYQALLHTKLGHVLVRCSIKTEKISIFFVHIIIGKPSQYMNHIKVTKLIQMTVRGEVMFELIEKRM